MEQRVLPRVGTKCIELEPKSRVGTNSQALWNKESYLDLGPSA